MYELSIKERFWRMVKPSHISECWNWFGNKTAGGYGRIQIKKKVYRAHRLSWELYYGPIPEGLVVCHMCDNPSCVKPTHLFIGTDGDNTRDRNAKGRANMPKGLEHFKAKLTEEQVKEIRLAKGSSRAIAKLYGVSHKNILAIKNRQTWKHV